MGRAEDITSFIKRYDAKLYCEKNGEGKLCIFRMGESLESYDVDGTTYHFVRPTPYLVFALTDDWSLSGAPADWGSLPILAKLKRSDLWQRDIMRASLESGEKAKASRDREADNHIESYLSDNRREFARITNDINTSTLNKT